MSDWSLRDKACVVGVGTTAYGSFPETDAYGLGADALRLAADDAGLKPEQIDGLIVSRIPSFERFAEIAGLNPRFTMQTPVHGRFASISLELAANALACGEANYIALVYGKQWPVAANELWGWGYHLVTLGYDFSGRVARHDVAASHA